MVLQLPSERKLALSAEQVAESRSFVGFVSADTRAAGCEAVADVVLDQNIQREVVGEGASRLRASAGGLRFVVQVAQQGAARKHVRRVLTEVLREDPFDLGRKGMARYGATHQTAAFRLRLS